MLHARPSHVQRIINPVTSLFQFGPVICSPFFVSNAAKAIENLPLFQQSSSPSMSSPAYPGVARGGPPRTPPYPPPDTDSDAPGRSPSPPPKRERRDNQQPQRFSKNSHRYVEFTASFIEGIYIDQERQLNWEWVFQEWVCRNRNIGMSYGVIQYQPFA